MAAKASTISNRKVLLTPGADLARLSIFDLVILHDAAKAAADGWASILNQPRVRGAAIENALEDESRSTNILLDSVIAEMQRRTPSSKEEADARAQMLLACVGSFIEWDDAAQILFSVAKFGSAPSGLVASAVDELTRPNG